ncbi:GNAT family N-acetyltransferase [Pseudomonas sp. TNT2022 ID642]|uniref:GNAT family N-acetyltransferase n=1 Tax=Pseudomonas sp. TNT2022 ID642 TaxID=2942632 RepID=UPI002361D40A|nr:GNAT family N-acetyltransferase [Pseudomonas sp. TNT2022 ID642]MDD1002728.1 GNAT family N-acetyltransferase [Pseudomonas sp. TNT2022 ID642]
MEDLIRMATREDAANISELIVNTLRVSNGRDYSPDVIEQVQRSFSPQAVLGLLGKRQVYVATLNQHIVATASLDQDVVRSVFVEPGCQGKGLGKRLMERLQSVAVSQGFTKLHVPSSITAEGFYRSLGFDRVRDEYHGVERTIIMQKQW